MRIHLILRSMWPKRAHVEDIDVGVVELIGLGDEACPAIPRIKGLLRGVATEMRVSCCLCSTHTPVLHRICFGADLIRRKRRARPSIRCLHPAYLVARATRKLLLGSACSVCASVSSLITDPNDADLRGALAQALLALDSDLPPGCS